MGVNKGPSGASSTYKPLQDDEMILMEEEETEYGTILYRASFEEQANSYVKYVTVIWILLSLLCLLVYGAGVIMLLFTPFVWYRARKDIQNRRLYITTENVVYKTDIPAICPCLGTSTGEKHVLLHLVTDVTVTQGWFQKLFGLHSVAIENPGQSGAAHGKADLSIDGISNPKLFKKILLTAAGCKRNGKSITKEDVESWQAAGINTVFDNETGNNAFNPQAQLATTSAMTTQMTAMNDTLGRIEKLLTLQLQMQNGGALPLYNDSSARSDGGASLAQTITQVDGQYNDEATSVVDLEDEDCPPRDEM
tara:strand:+ start:66 stop:989 length:924 start_codon:yes stop_codon:yes gene_type:complete